MCAVPPLISPFSFGDEPSNFGDSTGVQCMITKGDIPMNIKWMLNSILLNNSLDDGISIVKLSQKTSVLNIASVNEKHRGLYKCIAENKAAEVYYSAQLHVNGIYIILIFNFKYSYLRLYTV